MKKIRYNVMREVIFIQSQLIKIFGLSVLTSLFLLSCSQNPIQNSEKPNIILIMADDLGYECLSCNGSKSYKTPNLDKLGNEGVRFSNCYSTPLCTTSRVQLMTGMYNFRNYTEFGTMPAGQITFANLLKKNGYSTCIAGKWQLRGHYEGSGYKGKGTYPEENGFEEYCLWQLDKFGSRYWAPLLNINGEYHQYSKKEYGPDIVCDFILNYIDRHKRNPFLVYYPMILTHDPFVPTPRSQYSPKEINKSNPRFFKDMVEYADLVVGKIIKKLDQTNLRKNTLILFVGDNGTHKSITTKFKNIRIRGDKGKTTSAGTHVPLIVSWNLTNGGNKVCDNLVDFTDFLPTLLESAEVMDYNIPNKDGVSFLPQIKGERGNPRDWIYCSYDPKWGKFKRKRYAQTSSWKLYDDGNFYNFRIDPKELNPLPTELSPKTQSIRNKLSKVLEKMK